MSHFILLILQNNKKISTRIKCYCTVVTKTPWETEKETLERSEIVSSSDKSGRWWFDMASGLRKPGRVQHS
jgi:hypothetical protein